MSRVAKVTVAGAGVLGLASALSLADAGFHVTVCDPAEPAANASGVAAGMLAPAFEAALDPAAGGHFDLLMAARDRWPALEARAGLTLDRTGALAAGSAPWLAGVAGRLSSLGLHATELPRRTAEALAPGLSPALEGVLLSREDWRLDAAAGLAGLRSAAAAAGVVFRREAARDRGEADLLVIATGASQALAALAPELAVVSPIKGHILRVEAHGAGGVTVRGEGGYAVRSGGALVVGATMEAGVSDPAVDPAKGEALAQVGARLFPVVATAARRLQAGVRGAAPDGLPLVGFSAEPGVLLAVGARRNGWLLAPLVAHLVSAYAAGREPGRWAAGLDPKRFSSRG